MALQRVRSTSTWVVKESIAVGLGVLLASPFAQAFTAIGAQPIIVTYALIAAGLVLVLLSLIQVPLPPDGRAPGMFTWVMHHLGGPRVGTHPATVCFAAAALILMVRNEGWIDPCSRYAVKLERAVAQPAQPTDQYVPIVVRGTAALAPDPTRESLWLGISYHTSDDIRVFSQVSPSAARTWESMPISVTWGETLRYRVLLAEPHAARLFQQLVRDEDDLRYPHLPIATLQGVAHCAEQEFTAPARPG